MKLKSTIILFFFIQSIFAQSHPYEIKFSHQIESGIADESIRYSKAGLLYSFIGEYHLSNTYSDFPVSWGVDTLMLDSYNIEDALPKIISVAKNQQLVIISENHLKPQHRIFSKRIISELSKHGFSHLGIEALANAGNNGLRDSNLSERGYPLNSPLTGTYTLEPRMGQLVRKAIELDYNLFAYERFEKIKGMDRDEILADNIIKYLELHPNEKVIIHCGFHHAIESDDLKRNKYKWMAKHLKDKTGIDPLTIYQDNFTEKFIEDEHPYLSKVNITKPSVFTNNNRDIVQLSDQVDIEVIHPKTTYRKGRPNWLFEDDTFNAVKISKEIGELKYPLIASAYILGEKGAVPIDIVEVKHKYDNEYFVLGPGIYRIRLFDGINEIESEILVD